MTYQARFSTAIALSLVAHLAGCVVGNFPLVLETPAKVVVLEAHLLPLAVPEAPKPPPAPASAAPRDVDEKKPVAERQTAPAPTVARPEREAAEEAPPATIQRATEAPPARSSILILESLDTRLLEGRPIDVTAGRYYFPGEVDVRVAARDDVDPKYPVAALAAALPGRVVLLLLINERGGVDRKETLVAEPAIFEPYAYETIRQVRWAPAKREGENVRSLIMLDFRYRIDQ